MPGIYVQDSTIGPSIGNALARIADNYSPKTRAEAEALRLQMEGQNWSNRELSDKVTAKEQAASSVAGLLSQLGVKQPGGMSTGGPAGAAASQQGGLTDPTRRGFDTSNMTPYEKFQAARILEGANTEEVLGGASTFQNAQTPGSGFLTRTDIAKEGGMSQIRTDEAGRMTPILQQRGVNEENVRLDEARRMNPILHQREEDTAATNVLKERASPVTLVPGQTRYQNPNEVPGGVLSGGSTYQQGADQAQAAADVKAGEGGAEDFAGASHALENLRTARQMFNTHIGNTGPGDTISSAAQKAISDYTGVAVTSKAGAQLAIQKLINSQLGALARSENMQRVAGPEITVLMQQLPNGVMPAPVFNDLMSSMEAAAQMEQAASQAKIEYQNSQHTPQDAATMRNKIAQIYQNSPFDEIRRKYPNLLSGQGAQPTAPANPAPSSTPGGKWTIRPK